MLDFSAAFCAPNSTPVNTGPLWQEQGTGALELPAGASSLGGGGEGGRAEVEEEGA